MAGNNYESFRYHVENGVAQTVRSPLGTPITRSDGSQGILRDYAIPSHQFPTQRNSSLDRVALPPQGFM